MTYDKAFQVTMTGNTHTFDSFGCAPRWRASPLPSRAVASGRGWHAQGEGMQLKGIITHEVAVICPDATL
jgi:hypothetical protein